MASITGNLIEDIKHFILNFNKVEKIGDKKLDIRVETVLTLTQSEFIKEAFIIWEKVEYNRYIIFVKDRNTEYGYIPLTLIKASFEDLMEIKE